MAGFVCTVVGFRPTGYVVVIGTMVFVQLLMVFGVNRIYRPRLKNQAEAVEIAKPQSQDESSSHSDVTPPVNGEGPN